MFQNVIWGWVARRAVEVGGIGFAAYQLYAALPQSIQAAILRVLQGDSSQENLALAIGGIVLAAFGYLWSFRATTAPQVVTAAGEKILPKPDSVAMGRVETQAKAAPKRETLWERLTNRN